MAFEPSLQPPKVGRCAKRCYSAQNMGALLSYNFGDELQKLGETCPPQSAIPVEGDIYRGSRSPDLTDEDFRSFGELESKRHDLTKCHAWGLSVWTTEDAVAYAVANVSYVRKWHIHHGSLAPEHGVVVASPSVPQPEHHTFWKDRTQSVTALFSLYLEPEAV